MQFSALDSFMKIFAAQNPAEVNKDKGYFKNIQRALNACMAKLTSRNGKNLFYLRHKKAIEDLKSVLAKKQDLPEVKEIEGYINQAIKSEDNSYFIIDKTFLDKASQVLWNVLGKDKPANINAVLGTQIKDIETILRKMSNNFENWRPNKSYKTGSKIKDVSRGNVWECLESHTSSNSFPEDVEKGLWKDTFAGRAQTKQSPSAEKQIVLSPKEAQEVKTKLSNYFSMLNENLEPVIKDVEALKEKCDFFDQKEDTISGFTSTAMSLISDALMKLTAKDKASQYDEDIRQNLGQININLKNVRDKYFIFKSKQKNNRERLGLWCDQRLVDRIKQFGAADKSTERFIRVLQNGMGYELNLFALKESLAGLTDSVSKVKLVNEFINNDFYREVVELFDRTIYNKTDLIRNIINESLQLESAQMNKTLKNSEQDRIETKYNLFKALAASVEEIALDLNKIHLSMHSAPAYQIDVRRVNELDPKPMLESFSKQNAESFFVTKNDYEKLKYHVSGALGILRDADQSEGINTDEFDLLMLSKTLNDINSFIPKGKVTPEDGEITLIGADKATWLVSQLAMAKGDRKDKRDVSGNEQQIDALLQVKTLLQTAYSLKIRPNRDQIKEVEGDKNGLFLLKKEYINSAKTILNDAVSKSDSMNRQALIDQQNQLKDDIKLETADGYLVDTTRMSKMFAETSAENQYYEHRPENKEQHVAVSRALSAYGTIWQYLKQMMRFLDRDKAQTKNPKEAINSNASAISKLRNFQQGLEVLKTNSRKYAKDENWARFPKDQTDTFLQSIKRYKSDSKDSAVINALVNALDKVKNSIKKEIPADNGKSFYKIKLSDFDMAITALNDVTASYLEMHKVENWLFQIQDDVVAIDKMILSEKTQDPALTQDKDARSIEETDKKILEIIEIALREKQVSNPRLQRIAAAIMNCLPVKDLYQIAKDNPKEGKSLDDVFESLLSDRKVPTRPYEEMSDFSSAMQKEVEDEKTGLDAVFAGAESPLNKIPNIDSIIGPDQSNPLQYFYDFIVKTFDGKNAAAFLKTKVIADKGLRFNFTKLAQKIDASVQALSDLKERKELLLKAKKPISIVADKENSYVRKIMEFLNMYKNAQSLTGTFMDLSPEDASLISETVDDIEPIDMFQDNKNKDSQIEAAIERVQELYKRVKSGNKNVFDYIELSRQVEFLQNQSVDVKKKMKDTGIASIPEVIKDHFKDKNGELVLQLESMRGTLSDIINQLYRTRQNLGIDSDFSSQADVLSFSDMVYDIDKTKQSLYSAVGKGDMESLAFNPRAVFQPYDKMGIYPETYQTCIYEYLNDLPQFRHNDKLIQEVFQVVAFGQTIDLADKIKKDLDRGSRSLIRKNLKAREMGANKAITKDPLDPRKFNVSSKLLNDIYQNLIIIPESNAPYSVSKINETIEKLKEIFENKRSKILEIAQDQPTVSITIGLKILIHRALVDLGENISKQSFYNYFKNKNDVNTLGKIDNLLRSIGEFTNNEKGEQAIANMKTQIDAILALRPKYNEIRDEKEEFLKAYDDQAKAMGDVKTEDSAVCSIIADNDVVQKISNNFLPKKEMMSKEEKEEYKEKLLERLKIKFPIKEDANDSDKKEYEKTIQSKLEEQLKEKDSIKLEPIVPVEYVASVLNREKPGIIKDIAAERLRIQTEVKENKIEEKIPEDERQEISKKTPKERDVKEVEPFDDDSTKELSPGQSESVTKNEIKDLTKDDFRLLGGEDEEENDGEEGKPKRKSKAEKNVDLSKKLSEWMVKRVTEKIRQEKDFEKVNQPTAALASTLQKVKDTTRQSYVYYLFMTKEKDKWNKLFSALNDIYSNEFTKDQYRQSDIQSALSIMATYMGAAKEKFSPADPKQVISAKVKGESNILLTDQAKQALYYNSKIILYAFAEDINVRLAIGRILSADQIREIRDLMYDLFNVKLGVKDSERVRSLLKEDKQGLLDKKTIDRQLQHTKNVQKGTQHLIDKVNSAFTNTWLKVALKGDGPFYPPTVPLETSHIDPAFLQSMGEAYKSLAGIRKFVRQPGKENYSKTGFQPILDDNLYEDINKRITEIDNQIYQFGYYSNQKLSFRDAQQAISDICYSASDVLGNIMFFVDSIRQKDITFKTGRVEEQDPFTKTPLARYSFLQTNQNLIAPNMSSLRGYMEAMQRLIDSDQQGKIEQIKSTNARNEGENDSQYNDRISKIEKNTMRSEKKIAFEDAVKRTRKRNGEEDNDYLSRISNSVEASFSDNLEKLLGYCKEVFNSYDPMNKNATEGKADDIAGVEEFKNKTEQAKVFSERVMQGLSGLNDKKEQMRTVLKANHPLESDERIDEMLNREIKQKATGSQDEFVNNISAKIRSVLTTLNVAAESILKKSYPYTYKIRQSVAADKKGNAATGYTRQVRKTVDSNAVTSVFKIEDEIRHICQLAEINAPASLTEIGAWRKNSFYEGNVRDKAHSTVRIENQ